MRIHIDRICYQKKPVGQQIGGIKSRFTKPESIRDLTVQQIANAITGGRTVQPGVTPFSEKSRSAGRKGTVEADFTEQTLFMVDVDNAREDIPRITPEQIATLLAQHNLPIAFAYPTFSRTDEKEKFRVALVCDEAITDKQMRDRIQTALVRLIPQADPECVNADRIFFGTDKGLYEGIGTLDATCRASDLIALADAQDTFIRAQDAAFTEGTRNATMSHIAGRLLKRFGTEDGHALQVFHREAEKCSPALDDQELQTIWNSALNFYQNTVLKAPDYIPPREYALREFMQDATGKKKRPVITSDTIKALLEDLGITVRLNVISGEVEISGLPEQFSRTNAANVLPVYLMDRMKERGMICARQTLDDCLVLIEDENRFNPIADMLKATQYDGIDRLPELHRLLGITQGGSYTTYLVKWMWQTVALALNDDDAPCGADGVLVLQGEQGCGKTRFFTVLAMCADWFAEGVCIDIEKKDTIIQATGAWIAELGELDATLKREQSALKAFVTAARDTYRLPYARVAVRRPRRTSFCATVNPENFLNDDTGSRRYWTIHVDHIDVDGLNALSREWLAQLWKQIYVQYYLPNPQGFRLTGKERAELEGANERYGKALPFETEIRDNLKWDLPISRWNWFKTSELKNHLSLYHAQSEQIGRVLKKLAAQDERIQTKAPKNVRQYLLPISKGIAC